LLKELQEEWTKLERKLRKSGLAERSDNTQALLPRFDILLKQACDLFSEDNARLDSTINLLEYQVRNIRLLPLSTLFALFPRMVRDLSKEQGKEVELVCEGGDITVDKRILEEMKDPLMHLLRNAVDHGIEPAEEREQRGKSRISKLRLSAVRENANVVLSVQDDGRGLNPTAIRQQAQKLGLYDEATLAAMTPAQWQQLIFTPGFSINSYVTELSGRGVGLDVVRANVERMKGDIRLESNFRQGMTIQLRLPLSLSTTRLLLASVDGKLYGLPVEFVQTSLRVRKQDIFTLEGRLSILLNQQPIIAAYLDELLELPRTENSAKLDTLVCIVLQSGDEQLGLLVDDLLSEEEVVPKPLGAPLQRVRNISAVAMLGDGEICPVLNPADLLRSAYKLVGIRQNKESEIHHERGKPVVLLAEDSVLIRAMEKRILEDGGYEVVTAVDGLDALSLLDSRPFAAVVSDIMMPNMDGLTLTAKIRTQSRYKELPIILVTTLASDDDKQRGLNAGANAYIPKPAFEQRVLLDALKRLIVT
jgi:two-component system chemotaxis sensor kinase CheA